MMNNLFSVFDPTTGILSMNWTSTFILFLMAPYNLWFTQNKILIIFKMIFNFLNKEINALMKYKGTSIIMITLFIMILYNNLMGLMPYIFTSSAQLVFSVTLALPMWMSLMLYGWINKTNLMFCHLVPNSTPPVLMPFMVMIETISNIMRPGSLAVRLTANMIAGHLLMSLLGGNTSMVIIVSTMIIFIALMMFELAVALIQSYVFMTLMTLYSSEI